MAKTEKIKETISADDSLVKKGSYFLASFFGVGFIPVAPGTLGSLVSIPLAWFLWFAGGARALFLGVAVVSLLGLFISYVALKYTKSSDPSFIVIDEVAGQMATFVLPSMIFVLHVWSPFIYIAGFLLFRLFDILKPFHVGWIDRKVKGALGVMLDDLVAAVYATAILTLLCFLYFYVLAKTGNPGTIAV